jgi:hypothetical protein
MRTYIYTIKIIGINKSTTKSNNRYQMSELSSSVRILQYMFLSVVRDPLFISSPFVSDVVICWLPFYIVDIIHDFFAVGTQKNTSGLIYNTIHYITIFLALSNSIINPVIYGFLNANFQQEFLR